MKGRKKSQSIYGLCAEVERLTQQRDDAIAERNALMDAVEPVLIEVEPLRYKERQAIEDAVKAKKEWADTYNAIRRNDDEPWCFLSEYRRSLERQMEPLSRALWRANMVFDSIRAASQSPGDRKDEP